MNKLLLAAILLVCIAPNLSYAQLKNIAAGHLSGDLMLNQNFYQRDTLIRAANNPLYDNLLSGGEGWLGLQYNGGGFTGNVRFDMFNHSNLHDPAKAYSGQGIGMWSLSKEIGDFTVTGGYFYDQFGSGIVFRAYEDRGLGIDNAIVGLQLKYKLFNDKVQLKGFTGRQKDRFTTYGPVIKGINAESFFDVNGKAQLTPGLSFVNRTIDQASMDEIVASINAMPLAQRFVPTYNANVYSIYNTLSIGNVSWYAEYAGKLASEAIQEGGTLQNKTGKVIFSTINYSVKGFGATLQAKYTDHLIFRTSPNETLRDGMISFQPPMAKQNSLRLLSRYSYATQELGEQAAQLDVFFSPAKGYKVSGNFSHIENLNKLVLYQEAYADVEIKKIKKTVLDLGLQMLIYNKEYLEVKPGEPVIHTLSPFAELTYKITDKRSIRTEIQYLNTAQDRGSWAFVLIEYSIAPHYSFTISDMYNVVQSTIHPEPQAHYYNLFASYTYETTRFTIAYVKQVDGINCSGGVCRYEPAFSGVKMGVTSSF